MGFAVITVLVACALAGGAGALAARRRRSAERVRLHRRERHTRHHTGAIRSVQSADIYIPRETLERIWSPLYLERLARTYWRFLTRITLGLIRVRYTERERFVVAFVPALKLLTFKAPEYEMDERTATVRWRIERGLLVARRGRQGQGHLQITVRKPPREDPLPGRLHVEVEVANFYPAIAFGLSRRLYDMTQSRIHVIVTHAFLRSLARMDLAESRVGHFAARVSSPR
jgi:hypothetical protein